MYDYKYKSIDFKCILPSLKTSILGAGVNLASDLLCNLFK